jgi:adenosylcobinamide-phosphate synthase
LIDLAYTLLILGAALALDFAAGDPPNRLHPTAWIGRLINAIIPSLKHSSTSVEKFRGTIAATAIVALAALSTYFLLYFVQEFIGLLALVVVSVLLLKSTIAIRSMENHARAVMNAVAKNDLSMARTNLAKIVGRDTSQLDEQHILSATIESVGESTVDGITSPIFHYALFGVPGAFAYRAINTLDSMLGYRDDYHRNIGWFSAKLDTIANYIPARITAFLMVIAAKMIGADWKNSMYIMRKDRYKTPSRNAGWTMATIAGALRVKLEKVGYYSLGESYEHLTLQHCEIAISLMKITALLFCMVFALPAIVLLAVFGW